jgi:hypothetical protein
VALFNTYYGNKAVQAIFWLMGIKKPLKNGNNLVKHVIRRALSLVTNVKYFNRFE